MPNNVPAFDMTRFADMLARNPADALWAWENAINKGADGIDPCGLVEFIVTAVREKPAMAGLEIMETLGALANRSLKPFEQPEVQSFLREVCESEDFISRTRAEEILGRLARQGKMIVLEAATPAAD